MWYLYFHLPKTKQTLKNAYKHTHACTRMHTHTHTHTHAHIYTHTHTHTYTHTHTHTHTNTARTVDMVLPWSTQLTCPKSFLPHTHREKSVSRARLNSPPEHRCMMCWSLIRVSILGTRCQQRERQRRQR